MAKILAELPKLAPEELRSIRRKLIEISEENNEAASCDATILEGAQMLDRLEAEDEGR